jgi:inosine-uridine nucleoside N-ribohydrolase
MKKIIAYLLIAFIAEVVCSQPPSLKLSHSVIIDTDGGIDDMRAISLLLARPEITIKAILLSDGSLLPADGAEKVHSLLSEFQSQNIPVATGTVLKGVNPPWRMFNKHLNWGENQDGISEKLNSVDCLSEELKNSDEKIILVCLGPLTTVA